MRKRICGLLLILLCLAPFSACQNESVDRSETIPFLDIAAAEKITFKPGSKVCLASIISHTSEVNFSPTPNQ
jgi:hypothetical protein